MNCHFPGDTTARGSTHFAPRVFLLTVTAVLFSAVLVSRNFAAPLASKELTNSLGMKFRSIPAGEFVMGATPAELGKRRDQLVKRSDGDENGDEIHKEEIVIVESEGPQHRVTISKGYLLGIYEVTQQEFQSVMGFNPSKNSATNGRKDLFAGLDTRRHPVDYVSWNDAVEFCRQLSSLDEEVAAGRSYRLPTEAEWEYACRAGTASTFFWGEDQGKKSSDWTKHPKVVDHKKPTTVPVGSLQPNPWGLFDMSGNVREWCADWFDTQTYAKGDVKDPTGPTTGSERVVRGGMCNYFPPAYRSAARRKLAPDGVNPHHGFRVVCLQREIAKIEQSAKVPVPNEAQLKQKGLVRQGTFFVLAEDIEFARFTSTVERMRVACFNARREVEDAKKQLQRVSVAQAGALQARIDARNMMRYSDTWREHRIGVISRNLATDALAQVEMTRADVQSWLSDAEADYNSAVSRYAAQCKSLREMHTRLQAEHSKIAADPIVQQAVEAASADGKTAYRLWPSPSAVESLKKLEHEESVVRQLQGGKGG